jgi:EmrB/QacA subfamily drug resistance transporter
MEAASTHAHADRERWIALLILCLGTLMIVLDTTIVNVALPTIRRSLGFSQTSLAWVVNGYLLTFGGFLLLGGRLGDMFGARRLFIGGIGLFTLASLACGLSTSQAMLVVARVIQGFGGATVSAVSLALTMALFTEQSERAKAMGIFGFVASGGGTVGVLLGGILTQALSWHWIFLVNVPIGVLVAVLAFRVLPEGNRGMADSRLDVGGAVSVTAALMLAVYAIVNGDSAGWTSAQTLGLLAGAIVLLCAFVAIESRASHPLMPLSLFRHRNVSVANGLGILWAGALFAWFFMSALYLQYVHHYDPLKVGLSFLPASLLMGVLSLGVSAMLVMRFGLKRPLAVGMLLACAGLVLLARIPVHASFATDILPAMILLGLGGGIVFNPMLLAAMGDVPPEDSGVASGLVNTSFMMGGALGLAILASVATSRTSSLLRGGSGHAAALVGGYHLAFWIGAGFALAAFCVTVFGLRAGSAVPAMAHGGAPATAGEAVVTADG